MSNTTDPPPILPAPGVPTPPAYDAHEFTEDGLWQTARALWEGAASVFGDPRAIADEVVWMRRDWREAHAIVATLERLVRLLLLILATRLIKTLTPLRAASARKTAPPPASQRPETACIIHDQPAGEWPAPFTTLRIARISPETHLRLAAPHPLAPSTIVRTRGLAVRFESLRRALENADPRARRLARRLARLRATQEIVVIAPLEDDRHPWAYWHLAHAHHTASGLLVAHGFAPPDTS